MSTMTAHNLDLSAPPVVRTIGQRSLVIGLLFAAFSAACAYWSWENFIRAYLMGILMLRHLTKGAWGMVIRRILGAAMRNVWVVTVLFIPIWIEVFLGRHDL